MITDRYIKLIDKLSSKTQEKKVIWQRSSSQDEFKLELEKGAITIGKYEGDFNNAPEVFINIYNDRGDRIDVISINGSDKHFEYINEFYSSIRRSYYKVDETIDSIFNELESDKTLGAPEISEDDDLPF